MNKLITLLVSGLLASSSALAQVDEPPPPLPPGQKAPGPEIFTYVEQMPEAPFDVSEYLSKTIVYPKDAQMKNIEGRVLVKFVVDENGFVKNVTIAKSVYPSIDSTALAVIRKMPKWKPGRSKGKPVKVYYTLPIKFRLEDPEPVKKNEPFGGGVR